VAAAAAYSTWRLSKAALNYYARRFWAFPALPASHDPYWTLVAAPGPTRRQQRLAQLFRQFLEQLEIQIQRRPWIFVDSHLVDHDQYITGVAVPLPPGTCLARGRASISYRLLQVGRPTPLLLSDKPAPTWDVADPSKLTPAQEQLCCWVLARVRWQCDWDSWVAQWEGKVVFGAINSSSSILCSAEVSQDAWEAAVAYLASCSHPLLLTAPYSSEGWALTHPWGPSRQSQLLAEVLLGLLEHLAYQQQQLVFGGLPVESGRGGSFRSVVVTVDMSCLLPAPAQVQTQLVMQQQPGVFTCGCFTIAQAVPRSPSSCYQVVALQEHQGSPAWCLLAPSCGSSSSMQRLSRQSQADAAMELEESVYVDLTVQAVLHRSSQASRTGSAAYLAELVPLLKSPRLKDKFRAAFLQVQLERRAAAGAGQHHSAASSSFVRRLTGGHESVAWHLTHWFYSTYSSSISSSFVAETRGMAKTLRSMMRQVSCLVSTHVCAVIYCCLDCSDCTVWLYAACCFQAPTVWSAPPAAVLLRITFHKVHVCIWCWWH
jgi:hypothetical protein